MRRTSSTAPSPPPPSRRSHSLDQSYPDDRSRHEHQPQQARLQSAGRAAASKRGLSPALPPPKKHRGTGERVSTRDFIPPDVSGLSKREARLVKNRAAACLSRQRKREEFENMEV